MKNKAAWLLSLLLCLSWGATFLALDSVSGWARGIRIEGPNWFAGGISGLFLPSVFLLAFVCWLQRDNLKRPLAAIAATAALLFCILDAQAIIWCLLKLNFVASQPGLLNAFGSELGIQIGIASVALTPSALCLWLCARIAGPKSARPLASWRDWKNWSNASSFPTSNSSQS